ncbi:MAG: hypothetical protein V1834_02575 [Candidatus Micrarchaeota archaeon]
MINGRFTGLLGLAFFLSFVGLASASCEFMDISFLDSATVQQGVQAVYPIAITNNGLAAESVYLNTICPAGLSCSFDPVPNALLQPSGHAEFTFKVGTAGAQAGAYLIPVKVTRGFQSSACEVMDLTLIVNAAPVHEEPTELFIVSIVKPEAQAVRPGEKLSYALTVKNNDVQKAFARVKAIGDFSSGFVFSSVDFDVLKNSEKTVTAKLTVPPGTPSGTYRGVFEVLFVTASGVQYTREFSYDLFVFSDVLDLVLENEPLNCVEATHDDEVKWTFRLRNEGGIVGPFKARIEGDSTVEGFVEVKQDLIEVEEGDSQPLELVFAPSHLVPVDSYSFNLVVSYLGATVFNRQYCVHVEAETGFEVVKESVYEIPRCSTVSLPIEVKNTGTLVDSYQIEVEQRNGFYVVADPGSFKLSPGESKQVNLVVSTSLFETELGRDYFNIVVRSAKAASKRVRVDLAFIASGKQGESFLSVQEDVLSVVRGTQTTVQITAFNSKSVGLPAVELSIDGLDASWVQVNTPVRDIPAKTAQVFEASIFIPATISASSFVLKVKLASPVGEAVEKEVTLLVTSPKSSLNSQIESQSFVEENGVKKIVVAIRVTNTGNTVLSGISPSAVTGFMVSNPASISLEPGESQQMLLELNANEVSGDSASIVLKSSDGTYSNQVNFPAVEPDQGLKIPVESWTLVALLLLLVALFLFMTQKEREYVP